MELLNLVFLFSSLYLVQGVNLNLNGAFSMTPTEACREQVVNKNRRFCHGDCDVKTIAGLDGSGWDNLRNLPMATVMNLTYTKCQSIGSRYHQSDYYLVPDSFWYDSQGHSSRTNSATYYKNFAAYYKTRAYTINNDNKRYDVYYERDDADDDLQQLFGISGSFDAQFQDAKEKFISGKTVLLHNELVHGDFKIRIEYPIQLDENFVMRIREIYDALQQQGLDRRKAKYLAELIIRDFGTHVMTRADIGTYGEQEDYIDIKATQDQETSMLDLERASYASFYDNFKLSSYPWNFYFNPFMKPYYNEKAQEKFNASLRHTKIYINRGSGVNYQGASDHKEDKRTVAFSLKRDVAVIDREGVLLYSVINENNLKNINASYVEQIASLVRNATVEYYNRNRIVGCTDPEAYNFDSKANIGDDTCHKPYNKYTIGGIFQKCRVIYANETIGDVQYRCDNYRQINENTGDYSCNMGLRAIKLLDVEVNLPIRTERRSYQECSGYLFWKTCKTFEYDIHFQDNALIETYICQAEDPRIAHKEKFYNFGGIYEQNYTNPEEPCPGRFNKYTLFNNTICLSKVSDSRFSMEFGGFFTCQTEEEDARCPVGLTQNLATVMDGCNVYYCSKQNENKVLDEIRWKINRPPFEPYYENQPHE